MFLTSLVIFRLANQVGGTNLSSTRVDTLIPILADIASQLDSTVKVVGTPLAEFHLLRFTLNVGIAV